MDGRKPLTGLAVPAAERTGARTHDRIDALDGIRGIAAAGIVLYHVRGGAPVGLGQAIMELFFALSGYLITGVLIDGSNRPRRYRTFYLLRGFRLLPALYCFIAISLAIRAVGLVGEDGTSRMGWASALYVGNWWEIFHAGERNPPFGGLWSLAVEEQFYVIWPALCFAALALRRQLRSLFAAALLVAVASFGVRLVAVVHHWDLTRVRDGLDTRMLPLALGACVRAWMPPGGLTQARASVIGMVAAAAWVMSVATCHTYAAETFTTSWLLSGIAAAVLVGACASGGLAAQIFAFAPIRLCGVISYSLYLWHPLVIAIAERHAASLSLADIRVVELVASFGVAIVSYVTVERPVRRVGRRWTLRSVGQMPMR